MWGRLCSAAVLTGTAVLVGSAASGAPPVDSELFAYAAAECTGGGYVDPSPILFTRAGFTATADDDNDVNAGDIVSVGLGVQASSAVGWAETFDNVVGLSFAAETASVTRSAFTVPTSDVRYEIAARDFTVPASSAGTVVLARANSWEVKYWDLATSCTTAGGQGVVGLYVNKAPALTDDSATTDFETAVVTDVLANDDATNDSGAITSKNPTPSELTAQDDVAAALPSQVSISTPPSHGTASIESDGKLSYTPDADFDGTDSVTYSVTDNDGATSTAKLTITVADDTPVVPGPGTDPDPEPKPEPEPEPEPEKSVDPVDEPSDEDQTLPDTGAPALSTLWLGAGLVGVGSAVVAGSRARRGGQHRG